jgi:hypothetical protein
MLQNIQVFWHINIVEVLKDLPCFQDTVISRNLVSFYFYQSTGRNFFKTGIFYVTVWLCHFFAFHS